MARMTTPIVALDFPTAEKAMALVERLEGRCTFYKIGNELFTAAGPDAVRAVRSTGADVFLDLKFHDIPNTVAGGVRSAAAMGARLVTVHASGGRAMLEAAVKAAGDQGRCGVLAVSVLTSLTGVELAASWGRPEVDVSAEVIRLAHLAAEVGADGLVCSGKEAPAVSAKFGERLGLLVPGVRLAGEAVQDQARVVTPADAVRAGARYIVLGRAVTEAADPVVALERINAEIAAARR
jgi:orotidine-5'-phosphate decarboxylase